jgi:hypothetical protein
MKLDDYNLSSKNKSKLQIVEILIPFCNCFSFSEVIINQGKGEIETNEGTQIEKNRTVLNHGERSEGEGENKNKNVTNILNVAIDNVIKERKEIYDIPVENKPNSFENIPYNNGNQNQEYWKDYSYSGEGTYFDRDGSKYDGQIVNGLKNGFGRILYPNGGTYEGSWRHGIFSGMGTSTWPDGLKYVGWHDYDQRNGYGKMFYPNGDVYEGYWRYGQKYGKGTMHYIDGYKYYGDWVNDLRHGYGVEYYTDGQIFAQGPYYYGNFVG